MRLWIKIHCSWPPSYDPYLQNNHRIHEPTGSGLAQELSISIAAIALRLERSQGLCHRVAIASLPAISRRCFKDIYHLSLWKREVSLFVQMKELQKKTGGSLTGFGPWLWHWSWIFCRRWESHKAKNCPWVSKWAIRFCMVLSYTPDCRSLAIDKRSSSKPRRRNALLSLDSVIHLVNSTGVQQHAAAQIQHVSTLQATPCEAWPHCAMLSWGLCHKSSRRQDGPGKRPRATSSMIHIVSPFCCTTRQSLSMVIFPTANCWCHFNLWPCLKNKYEHWENNISISFFLIFFLNISINILNPKFFWRVMACYDHDSTMVAIISRRTAFHGRVAPPLNRSTEVAVTRSSPMGAEWRRGVNVLERLVRQKSGAKFLAPNSSNIQKNVKKLKKW